MYFRTKDNLQHNTTERNARAKAGKGGGPQDLRTLRPRPAGCGAAVWAFLKMNTYL